MASCPKCGRIKVSKNKKTKQRICRRCGPLSSLNCKKVARD